MANEGMERLVREEVERQLKAKKLDVKQLPLKELMKTLEAKFLPNADTFLLKHSVGLDSLVESTVIRVGFDASHSASGAGWVTSGGNITIPEPGQYWICVGAGNWSNDTANGYARLGCSGAGYGTTVTLAQARGEAGSNNAEGTLVGVDVKNLTQGTLSIEGSSNNVGIAAFQFLWILAARIG